MTRVIISAVPWELRRAQRAQELAAVTGGEIVWDELHSGYDTYVRALMAAGHEPAIFLEDDLILADRFVDRIEAEIALRPDSVINFFSYWLKRGGWKPPIRYTANLCHYLPAGVAYSMSRFAPQWNLVRSWPKADQDMLVRDWLIREDRKYWLRAPSLVQHESWSSVTASYRSSARQSPTFQE